MPTIAWRYVSLIEKASNPNSFAKLGNVKPNAAAKRNNNPLKIENGFQKFLLLQPNFIMIIPSRM